MIRKVIIKNASVMIAVFLLFVCSPACGKNEGKGQEQQVVNRSEECQFDWKAQKMLVAGDIQEGQPLSVVDYKVWEHTQPQNQEAYADFMYAAEDGCFYTLERYIPALDGIYLASYDVSTLEQKSICLPLKQFKTEDNLVCITAMDIGAKDRYAFQINSLVVDEKGKLYANMYQLIQVDSHGKLLSNVDILPFYQEKQLLADRLDVFNPVADCIIDEEGYSYTRVGSTIYIADSEGKELMVRSYGDDEYITITNPVRSDDGKLVFAVNDGVAEKVHIVWFDTQAKAERILAELEYGDFGKLYAMAGRYIYYEASKEIVKWNVIDGDREILFSYKDNGIMNTKDTMLVFDEWGTPMLRVVSEEEDIILKLGVRERTEESIQVADISYNNSATFVKAVTADFTRRNPLYSFVCEKPQEGQEDDYRDRIMAELAAGKGPDILYLSREDLNSLPQETFLDLRELIPSETLQQLLPGAVELGTFQDTLLGIPVEVQPETLFTYGDIWEGDSWSLTELMKIAEEKDGLRAVLPSTSEGQMHLLLLTDLEHSPFIDWERGESHFDSAEFCRILEYFKSHGLEETLILDKDYEALRNEECLAVIGRSASFTFYESIHKKLGENIKAIGYPVEGGNGSFLRTNGVLAVNAKSTADREAVAAFLEYVLSKKGQKFCIYGSVRRNEMDENDVIYKEDGSIWLKEASGSLREMVTKEDGSTYIQDYNRFVETCVAYPLQNKKLVNIIDEELEAYFGGNYSADKAAELIDNRVQLYLDERK